MDTLALRRLVQALVGFLALTLSGFANAEPPSRAARLAYVSGTISFAPAGQPDWVQVVANRPLTTGDRLWSDERSRAELQVGGAAIRLGATTSATLLNLDDRIVQVQLSQGTLKVRVRHLAPDQTFEVDTPNLALTLRHAGDYRIEVDANDDATAVTVLSGEAEAYGEGRSYSVDRQQGYRFYGTGLSDYEPLPTRRDDDFDRWARDRDRRGDESPSARYVSSEVVGYEDLDANGTWRADPSYGNVWVPTRVAAGWTPYHDGHWAWVDPWGWTWVDDAPWGYAVSHYGRWASINGAWAWVPGPPRERAVYAPALVAFVGGDNFKVSVSVGSAAAVGWFPLAPREVYRPSYPVSRGYFDQINRSNAVIAPTTITNVYNTTNVTQVTQVTNNTTIVNNTNVTKVVYVNQQVTGAVVAVPAQAFAQSQSVAKAAVPVSREAAVNASAAHVAAVAPVQQSVHGGAAVATARPPARELAVVAKTAPPPPPILFSAQQKQLAAKPGTPIDEAQRTQLKPVAAAAASAPKVSVVTVAQVPAPTVAPPPKPAGARSSDARRADSARAITAQPGASNAGSDPRNANEPKAVAGKQEAAGADAAKAEAAKAENTRADAVKAEAAKVDSANRAEAARAKTEADRAAAAKAEATKAEAAKVDAVKTEVARVEAAKAEAAKTEAAKVKADAERAASAKAERTRADAAKAEAAAKVDDTRRAEAATAKAEADRAAATKVEARKAEAAKAATPRAPVGAPPAPPPPPPHAAASRPEHEPKTEEQKKRNEEDGHKR